MASINNIGLNTQPSPIIKQQINKWINEQIDSHIMPKNFSLNV